MSNLKQKSKNNINPKVKDSILAWPAYIMKGKLGYLFQVSGQRKGYYSSMLRYTRMDYLLYTLFCLVSFLTPIFFFNNHPYLPDDINILVIRIVYLTLCSGLAINSFLPGNYLSKFSSIYWYVVLFYTLPCYSTYMLIFKYVSKFFICNALLSFFLLALLVDWFSFIVISVSGTIAGILLHLVIYRGFNDLSLERLSISLYMLVFSAGLAFTFARKKENSFLQKINNLRLLAASIAHEIRTPLATIKLNLEFMVKNKGSVELAANKESLQDSIFSIDKVNNIIDSILLNTKDRAIA